MIGLLVVNHSLFDSIEALASSLIVLGRYDRVVMDLIEEGKNGYLFDDENELFEKIQRAKQLIAKKNIEYKLPNGDSIADSLITINLLRKKQYLLENLLNEKSSKRRVTEVNNSYFEAKSVNFDADAMREVYDKIHDLASAYGLIEGNLNIWQTFTLQPGENNMDEVIDNIKYTIRCE